MNPFLVIAFLTIVGLFSCTDILDDSDDTIFDLVSAQSLYNEEINPNGSSIENGFDGSLEEILHLITDKGYAKAYPDAFGRSYTSQLAQAMDKARGGVYRTVPSNYPATAWYTYNDATCDYYCQMVEYFYWGVTSMLGFQEYSSGSQTRLNQIENEWRQNTAAKMAAGDTHLYALITEPTYGLPSRNTTILNYPITNSTIDFTIATTLPAQFSEVSATFTKYMTVFGVHLFATTGVEDAQLIHAAKVLAGYLDNNGDGVADDATVLSNMVQHQAAMVITVDQAEFDSLMKQNI